MAPPALTRSAWSGMRGSRDAGPCSTSTVCRAETQTTQSTTAAPVLNPWQRCVALCDDANGCVRFFCSHQPACAQICAAARLTSESSVVSPQRQHNHVCRYCIALDRHPFITKACTSLCGFMLGDVLAQKLEGSAAIELARVARLGAYGFLLDGPVGHLWYRCASNASVHYPVVHCFVTLVCANTCQPCHRLCSWR